MTQQLMTIITKKCTNLKHLVTFLLLLSFSTLTAQNKVGLNKIWISPYLDYLDLSQDSTAYFDYGMGYREKYYLEKEDSLFRLIEYKWISGVEEPRKIESSYKIIKMTSDTLLLHPLTKYSKIFVENEDKSFAAKFHNNPEQVELKESDIYTFVDKSILYDSAMHFNMLYFSSTPCYGSCPAMEFEIDSLGNICFIGKMNTGKYKGNYKGRLRDKQFNALKEILKSSALDFMPIYLRSEIDAPDFNLTIHYNGKIKTVAGGSAYPYFNQPLFEFLLTKYRGIKMKETKEINFILKHVKEEAQNHE